MVTSAQVEAIMTKRILNPTSPPEDRKYALEWLKRLRANRWGDKNVTESKSSGTVQHEILFRYADERLKQIKDETEVKQLPEAKSEQ
jgi:hypothetical protein